MNGTKGAVALLLAWIAALAALGWYVNRQLVIGADLRLFLPSATTPEQRLLLEEIGEGPASRVLVISIAGAAPEELADASRALVAALDSTDDDELFRLVTNGELSLDAIPDELLSYRYLLAAEGRFDAAHLHAQLQARARDLASPAGAMLEPLLPRDPTLEILKLLQDWQPVQEPHRQFDVWFDAKGERALLLAETIAPAFDPDRQRVAIDELRRAFYDTNPSADMRLTISGPGAFSVLMESRTRTEAQTLAAAASVGMIILLLAAYRRFGYLILSALPLLSAGIAGLFAVSLLFGEVHGITLAFGFTLIGVAQDYPAHLLSHQQPGRTPLQIVRELWPTLATGVVSTCIAYATFLFSGVVGLRQLACFTVTGLAIAGLTTRFVLPRLIAPTNRDYGESPFLGSLWRRVAHLPAPPLFLSWASLALAVVCATVIALAPGPLWENDLSKLTPVPRDLLAQDQELRTQLGTADLRYLLVLEAADVEAALAKLEELDAPLRQLAHSGAIDGYDSAARYLPSRATQLARQAELPDAQTLRATLQQALVDTPFRVDAFEPFVRDVEQARKLPPLAAETLRDSPLGASLDMLLNQREGNVTALVTFAGVNDPQALQQFAASAGPNVLLLDLKLASESLVAQQRSHLLWSLGIAAILLAIVVAFALRSRHRILRVLAPMALTTLILVAALHGAGVALTMFHLIALILAAGLGLDYALFFEHAAGDPQDQRRTLHAVLVCSLSTLLVFALLATSTLPILQAIGVTVSLGVVLNFVLALLLTRSGSGTRLGARGAGEEELHLRSASGPSPVHQAPSPPALLEPRRELQAPSPLSSLIPHQGTMCLLEHIVDWDEQSIRLETTTHRSADNPLRCHDRLRAIHLCEYGAQAMAVHGALKTRATGGQAPPGMLVSLRAVSFDCDYVEDLPGSLLIEAQCLQAGAASQQYSFRISHAGAVLAEGRAAVMLDAGRTMQP